MVTKHELEVVLECVKTDDLKFDEESLEILKYRIRSVLKPFLEDMG